MQKQVFNIIFGIIIILLLVFIIFFSLRYIDVIYEFSNLKWIAVFACILSYYIAGVINKNTSIKWLFLLILGVLIFKPFRYLYFPFFFILLFFSISTLILTRRHVKKQYKILLSLIMVTLFMLIMFSQPMILKKENFKKQYDGSVTNTIVIWDFTKEKKTTAILSYQQFIDINKNTVMLSAFEGKTMFVSFWATWCAPCLREKPILDQIKEKHKTKSDVVFVDISIDHDFDAWQSYLQKSDMKGIQLNTDGNEIKIMNEYKFSGIPFHILVSPDGVYKQNDSLQFVDELLRDREKLNSFIKN
ncbi:TlpA family protein disulfide reductase [Aquimarina algicola]|uniref:TlpA family protein disulfide reductase n=2 Tax=Aquimarina algicola TaxID=2589995 RepID=A0A504J4Y0_9FLAO|nr:TlpA family protein disulfide reductase [Aquimarina algicola]